MGVKLGKRLHKRPRRDQVYFIGLRASKLNPHQSAVAWEALSRRLLDLSEHDLPKFHNLLDDIRTATIIAKQLTKSVRLCE